MFQLYIYFSLILQPAYLPSSFFFFNDTATTEIYTLSLHDALPIYHRRALCRHDRRTRNADGAARRSEEHTSELQSHSDLVCRLLLEQKKKRMRSRVEQRNEIIGKDRIDGHLSL